MWSGRTISSVSFWVQGHDLRSLASACACMWSRLRIRLSDKQVWFHLQFTKSAPLVTCPLDGDSQELKLRGRMRTRREEQTTSGSLIFSSISQELELRGLLVLITSRSSWECLRTSGCKQREQLRKRLRLEHTGWIGWDCSRSLRSFYLHRRSCSCRKGCRVWFQLNKVEGEEEPLCIGRDCSCQRTVSSGFKQ